MIAPGPGREATIRNRVTHAAHALERSRFGRASYRDLSDIRRTNPEIVAAAEAHVRKTSPELFAEGSHDAT